MQIALILLVVGLVIAALVYAGYLAAKRRQAIEAWGRSKGLRFRASKDRGMDSRFRNFSCLRKGSRRYAYNILEGDYSGYPCLTFDYHYETYSRNSKGRRTTHHHRFSSVILGSRVPLKPLFIRTEGFFDKITEFIGIDDIDFESAEFSRTFFVKADDRRWAFDVIHQQTMEFLLAAPRFTIQFERSHVIAFRTSKFKAPEFEQAVETVKGILDRLPEYVIRQQTGEA